MPAASSKALLPRAWPSTGALVDKTGHFVVNPQLMAQTSSRKTSRVKFGGR
jgi:hypothetical protein